MLKIRMGIMFFIFAYSSLFANIRMFISSISRDIELYNYSVFNIFDNSLNSCYAYRYRNDLTNHITINFKTDYKIDKIVIYNGYWKKKDLWIKNRKIKELNIVLSYKSRDWDKVYDLFAKGRLSPYDKKAFELWFTNFDKPRKNFLLNYIGKRLKESLTFTAYDLWEDKFWKDIRKVKGWKEDYLIEYKTNIILNP